MVDAVLAEAGVALATLDAIGMFSPALATPPSALPALPDIARYAPPPPVQQ